jgi:hypothetical protein
MSPLLTREETMSTKNHEIYKLICAHCGATIELTAGRSDSAERRACPRCAAELEICWRGEEQTGTSSNLLEEKR